MWRRSPVHEFQGHVRLQGLWRIRIERLERSLCETEERGDGADGVAIADDEVLALRAVGSLDELAFGNVARQAHGGVRLQVVVPVNLDRAQAAVIPRVVQLVCNGEANKKERERSGVERWG
jgi:hypothetical protein